MFEINGNLDIILQKQFWIGGVAHIRRKNIDLVSKQKIIFIHHPMDKIKTFWTRPGQDMIWYKSFER